MINCERYITRSLCKMRDCAKIYGTMIFRPVGRITEAACLRTAEHLRTVHETGLSPLKEGDGWGGEFGNLWIRLSLTVPEAAAGKKLFLIPHTGAYETLCFLNGKPSGLVNAKFNPVATRHYAFRVCSDARPGDEYDVAFECYAGHGCLGDSPYASYGKAAPDGDFSLSFGGIDVCVMDELIKDFYYDFQTVIQLAKDLPKDNFAGKLANDCLNRAFPHLIQYPADGYSIEEIHESLRLVREALRPALEKGRTELTRGHFGLVGHSHIDTAWLWPMSETVRKCARTYSEALSLMDEYPEYCFVQSGALHADWMRRYYPTVFADMVERAREGRWEPVGGVWVECDCNLTGGEYLIRQFLYGIRFTEQYFGRRSKTFWLPDTFGYSGAIPQIMKGCGLGYFCTTKLSWNDLTPWPLDTFRWRGTDGSEVLAHMNEDGILPDADAVIEAANAIADKRSTEAKLLGFGYGDGGGGPTYGMIEHARRITGGVAGLPEVHLTSVDKFMEELPQYNHDLPVFEGELYLEYHRGTLTQMCDIKRNNRLAEYALHHKEALEVAAGQVRSDADHEEIKLLLQNQFHDILPGTGLEAVNRQAVREVSGLIRQVEAETAALATGLTDGDGAYLTLFNPSPAPVEPGDTVTLPGAVSPAGGECFAYTDVSGRTVTDVCGLRIAPYGFASFPVGKAKPSASPFISSGLRLNTPYYQVIFDKDGYIASLYDKEADRELRRAGGAPLGCFRLGEDLPVSYDNWEIEWDAVKKLTVQTGILLSRKVIGDTAGEYRIRCRYRLGRSSSVVADTVFYAASRRIDYHLSVDWHEKHRLLKAGFDLAISTPRVKNEVQFGFAERPTTRNTPEEAAKFEVSNHKWSDLSEARYGVAVLNDCKYGISAEGGDLGLTLHRGGCRPDPTGDEGVHEMRYALLPHPGGWSAESVTLPSYRFNHRLVAAPGAVKGPIDLPVAVSNPAVIAETVKPAEDGSRDYVIRLYEAERSYAPCRITLPEGTRQVFRTNLLEEEPAELALDGRSLKLTLKPFEIVTLLVRR